MKKAMYITSIMAAFLLLGNAAFAGNTPDSLKGATLVDAVKAKSLSDSGVMMIDSRVANEYAESHIKGPLTFPTRKRVPSPRILMQVWTALI